MNSRAPLAWLLATCVVAALAGFILVKRPLDPGSRGGAVPSPGKPPSLELDGTDKGAMETGTTSVDAARFSSEPIVDQVSERGITTGATLAAFYGRDWEKVRPELEQRISLTLVPDIPLPAWESVLDRLQAAMQVSDAKLARLTARYAPPDPVRLDYLRERFEVAGLAMDDRDIVAIEAVLVEPRAEIQDRMHRVRILCNAILAQKFRFGEYNYGPFANIYTDKIPKSAFYADSIGIQGWSVSWAIAPDEDPELKSTLLELAILKKQINATIQKYLSDQK